MTVHKPEPDEVFYADDLKRRLRYVGTTLSGELVLESLDTPDSNSSLITVTPAYARDHLVTWTAESVEVEQGQLWDRTRNDFMDRRAFVLAVIEWRDSNYVIYEEIGGHGPNPKMKKEIDFRRVFGRLLTSDDLIKERGENGS
jgi:hypothetical protein